MEKELFDRRRSGVLLHPVSLPSKTGIGDFGTQAYHFVELLAHAGQSVWQILPLSPVGWGDSPYQSPSAFAGEPLMIDLEWLYREDFLSPAPIPDFSMERIEYEEVRSYKMAQLQEAFKKMLARGFFEEDSFRHFCKKEDFWLDDYALFMAIKSTQENRPWQMWEKVLRRREPHAMEDAKKCLANEILWHRFLQYLFFKQWQELKRFANERGVFIVGDVPIYVAEDSADVWAHQELFELDENGYASRVAGVPPDYFSPTGQRWGNPLYAWSKLRESGYAWWIDRMDKALEIYDAVRIDHFRGFAAFWAIPRSEETAINGEWVEGPGEGFFRALQVRFGATLPLIAEDLGIITEDVRKLRDTFGLPGMKILQFAFDGSAQNPYLPHNYTTPRCIAYTGTHDNDTTVGWFETIDNRTYVDAYLSRSDDRAVWRMIRESQASIAIWSITPMQDLLGLGSEARMNRPGTVEGNWCWRMRGEWMEDPRSWERLKEMTHLYGRVEH